MKINYAANCSLHDKLKDSVKKIFPDATSCTAILEKNGISIFIYNGDTDLGDIFYDFKTEEVTHINQY